MSLIQILTVVTSLATASAQKLIDLNGPGWTLKDSNGSLSIPASVPSQQYLDLFDNGVIGDPVYGMNETAEQWVQLTNWTYISKPLDELGTGEGKSTWLIFEGLDTFVDIKLCNKKVGSTNNQFRQWLFDVTDILGKCHGTPRLALSFKPAVTTALAISKGPDGDGDDNFADSCSDSNPLGCKVYARKEQNDFGWDWSPHLVPAGPWRPIYAVHLTQLKPVYVNNALIDIYRKGQRNNLVPNQSHPWVFNASLDFVGDLPAGAAMQMTLKDTSGKEILQTELQGVYSSNMAITGSTIIDPAKVELWWPAGYGTQTLYDATITVTDKHGHALTHVDRRVGFRTIVLNLNPITKAQIALGVSPGSNWHFEVNGNEIYVKGSNLVPPSPFWPSVNETKVRQLFELAVQGNQNMFRVWASGAYLDDWIYDIADEMGILLWSEFEFSDAEYPNTTTYLQNYEAEAYYNVRRVNHHPSLALWVGGNELEAIIIYFFFGGSLQKQYEQIFLEVLIKCVYANTRSISYMPSSTYHGYLSLDFDRVMPQLPRYLNTSGPNYLYSNTDYYNYDSSQAFNLSAYPIGRLANEFGFHSMSSLQSWEAEAPPSDLYLQSPTVVYHNRHYPFGASGSNEQLSLAGIQEMVTAVNLWYPTPNLNDPIANFTAWIYSTQVFQADYYQHQIAFYRRGSGMPERQLGALYWMFEDLWAAPTWASVDVLGRQKVVYYAAKDIFKPVIGYGYYNISTTELQVWVTSDLWTEIYGTVTAEWFNFAGKRLEVPADIYNAVKQPPANATHSVSGNATAAAAKPVGFTVGPINSTNVLEYFELASTLKSHGYSVDNAVLKISVSAKATNTGLAYTHTSWFHPASLANVTLHDPGLKVTHGGAGNHSHGKTVSFTVTAEKGIAAWVWLDYTSTAIQGYWSENGFWLGKGESKIVTFTVFNDWSGGEWVDTVIVRSLWDNTQH
jgi:beta-mannosidase